MAAPKKKPTKEKRNRMSSPNGKSAPAPKSEDLAKQEGAPPPIPLPALGAIQAMARIEVLEAEEREIDARRAALQREIGQLETQRYAAEEKMAPLVRQVEEWEQEAAKRAEVILELEKQRERIRERVKTMRADFKKHQEAEAAAAPSIPAEEKIPAAEGGT